MRIAVIGGNLLGCATTLDLALIQEHDESIVGSTVEKFQITVFEKEHRLGGCEFKSVPIDPDLRVEVGVYRTLPILAGTYLHDLVSAANDARGTFPIFNRRYAIPGASVIRRGAVAAANVVRPWSCGSYHSLIPSFSVWDWRDDAYHLIYRGWWVLDLLYRLLDNQIWRSVALAGLLYSINRLRDTAGQLPRAYALAQCMIMVVVLIASPKSVVAYWQRHYSFWGTTLPLLVQHGITPAISRGSTIGFLKQLIDLNNKNLGTCAISIGTLIQRGGLDAYLRGTGDDYVRQFNYQRKFVQRYMEPIIAWEHNGARLTEVSSLASHFAMLDGDFTNSDAKDRLCQIDPDNAMLCSALIDAAKATLDVDVNYGCEVQSIVYDDETKGYVVTYSGGHKAEFDGVALCASPKEGEMEIETPVGTSISDLLGYDRDVATAREHASEEAAYQAEHGSEGLAHDEAPVRPSTCSHFAVVVGVAKASFFRFPTERRIPDIVQMTFAHGASRFQRIREVSDERPGVYTVMCGEDFESSGLFAEMFESGTELKYCQQLSKSRYSHTALPKGKAIDDCMPFVVLGNRFVYVAAARRLARHPELDAMAAVNAASLFSRAVQWAPEAEEEGEEQGEEHGENQADTSPPPVE